MTVKADSKGRLTGAQPETRYTRKEHPDGRIEYIPEVPREFEEVREVTQEQFEEFFGVSPELVPANGGIYASNISGVEKDYLPHSLVVERFLTDESGQLRSYTTGPGASALRAKTLIKIRKKGR